MSETFEELIRRVNPDNRFITEDIFIGWKAQQNRIDSIQSENAALKEMLEMMADLFLPMESDYNDNHNKTQQGMNLLAEYREWKQKQI